MNLLRSALRRPVTVLVLILGVVLGAVVALQKMPRDIFPTLGIPTIYVAQPYGGMDPAQMEGYLTYYYEYHFLYITGIQHVESKSIQGVAMIKLHFHPGTDMAQAMAETVGYVNRARAFMPPGTVPPFVMRFDAGSVPVGNLVFSSETRSVGEMQDAALNRSGRCSPRCPGVSAPPPFGGSAAQHRRQRQPRPAARLQHVARTRSSRPSPRPTPSARRATCASATSIRWCRSTRWSETSRTWRACRSALGTYPAVFLRDVATVRGRLRHRHRLRAGQRPAHGLHPGHQAGGRLDPLGGQAGRRRTCRNSRACCPADIKVSYEFDQSPIRHPRDCGLGAGRGAGGGADRSDGAAVPAGLAQRPGRGAEHPAGLLRRGRRRSG